MFINFDWKIFENPLERYLNAIQEYEPFSNGASDRDCNGIIIQTVTCIEPIAFDGGATDRTCESSDHCINGPIYSNPGSGSFYDPNTPNLPSHIPGQASSQFMQIKELCAARDDPDGGAQQGELTAAQKTMCEKMEAIANNILITNFGLEVLWNNAALMNSTLHFLQLNNFSIEAQQFVTKMINDIENGWMDSNTAEVIMNIVYESNLSPSQATALEYVCGFFFLQHGMSSYSQEVVTLYLNMLQNNEEVFNNSLQSNFPEVGTEEWANPIS